MGEPEISVASFHGMGPKRFGTMDLEPEFLEVPLAQ